MSQTFNVTLSVNTRRFRVATAVLGGLARIPILGYPLLRGLSRPMFWASGRMPLRMGGRRAGTIRLRARWEGDDLVITDEVKGFR